MYWQFRKFLVEEGLVVPRVSIDTRRFPARLVAESSGRLRTDGMGLQYPRSGDDAYG